jgi:hypothetical protein
MRDWLPGPGCGRPLQGQEVPSVVLHLWLDAMLGSVNN